MSEELKKNLRTQGKYSDKPFHKGRDKRLKDSPGEREPPGKKSQKRNSNGCKSNTSYDGIESELTVRYQVNSSHSFNELDGDKKPTELNKPGEYILSETANGISKVLLEPNFIIDEEASWLYCLLLDSTEWNAEDIVIRGEKYPQPRLVAWYGPFPYTYSGVTLEPKEIPELISKLKMDIEDYLLKNGVDVTLNSVLLNYYRDGKDSVSWHSDDELTMGVCPTIVSISLGETRKFEMRRKIKSYEADIADNLVDRHFVNLTNGSLLVMDGCMQKDWQHRIPKEYHDKRGRINLTFRTVYPLDNLPTEMPTRKYENNQTRNTAWNTSSSSEKNCPPVGHYDEHFPSLGQPIATSSKMDTEREISDHEMDDVENKNLSLPNSTTINSAYSNIEENDVSENFESSNISCSMSEEHDNSSEYFDDASQSHDAYTGTDMNNLNDETQTFKHEVNKNVQVFDSPRNDSDTMNPDEESVGLDESYTDSSFMSENHIYSSQEFINKSFRNDSEVGTRSPSGLNVNAKEFVPSAISSPVSSPTCEEQKFDDSSIEKLFAVDIREMASDDFYKYADRLRAEILKRIGEFKTAEDDLSFLCDLLEDKLMSEITQRKIIVRMVNIGNMCLRSTQNNDNFRPKDIRPTQLENQRERSYSSRGSRFQGGRNDRRPESSGRENSKRQNFNREEYNERGTFNGRNPERRSEYWESGNSNRGSNSKRGNFNRDNYSRGRSSRGGRYSSNRSFGRGDAHRQGDARGKEHWDE